MGICAEHKLIIFRLLELQLQSLISNIYAEKVVQVRDRDRASMIVAVPVHDRSRDHSRDRP